jgi:hypothetical protein
VALLKYSFKNSASGLMVASLSDEHSPRLGKSLPKQNENQTVPDSGIALVANSRSTDLGGGHSYPDVCPIHLSMGDGLL